MPKVKFSGNARRASFTNQGLDISPENQRGIYTTKGFESNQNDNEKRERRPNPEDGALWISRLLFW